MIELRLNTIDELSYYQNGFNITMSNILIVYMIYKRINMIIYTF